jgi:hypothetical protein
MPAGLRARVSRLGGFKGPFSGELFPPAGARLFVIRGEAVTSRPRSPPILMGWWSVKYNDFTKVLIAAGRARQHHQPPTVQWVAQREGSSFWLGRLLRVFLGDFTLFMNDDARCGSKPARWRCGVFFTTEWKHHGIPEEPARRDSTLVPPSASAGPMDNMDASTAARKSHSHEMHERIFF